MMSKEKSPDQSNPAPVLATADTNSDALAVTSNIEAVSGPLVGLLGHHIGGLSVSELKKQRVYVSSLESKMKLNGKTSISSSVIALKFETIHRSDAPLACDPKEKGGTRISQEFMLEKHFAEQADKRIDTHRGLTAISTNFVRNDHSAIIARLAAAISRYSQYGELSWAQLTGGRTEIHNRDKIDGRIEHGSDIIYIPRVTGSTGESFAWYACVGSALGCGNKVVTDSTATDNNNRVILHAPQGAELVLGCMDALSRIGNYYTTSKAGVLFAWAMAYGFNKEMSLVAMTDEGGYIRQVCRRNRFSTSYGVIWMSVDRLASLPVTYNVSRSSAARFCDAVLSYFGASSAVCDPCVKVGDDYYPSIFTAGTTQPTIKEPPVPTKEEKKVFCEKHSQNISDASGRYCENMAKMLDRMIKAGSHDEYLEQVSGFLVACFASMGNTNDKHLQHRVVAPFYWIEPQNIIGKEAEDMTAQMQGYGVFVYRNVASQEHDSFEGISDLGVTSGVASNFYVKFTAARKNPMLQHLMNSSTDGLAAIIPLQTREDGLTMVGHGDNSGDFSSRAQAKDDVGTYLWKHASCKIIAPAEMVQLAKGMGFIVLIGMYDTNYMFNRLFPGNAEDLNQKVTFKPLQYQGFGIRKRDAPFNREIVRANGLAAAALDTNRNIVGKMGDLFSAMPISASGAGPGVNIAEIEMRQPRRLIVSGEDPESVWSMTFGAVQKTVISHRLRHKASRESKTALLFGTGPTGEGGEETAAVDDPEDTDVALLLRKAVEISDLEPAQRYLNASERIAPAVTEAETATIQKYKLVEKGSDYWILGETTPIQLSKELYVDLPTIVRCATFGQLYDLAVALIVPIYTNPVDASKAIGYLGRLYNFPEPLPQSVGAILALLEMAKLVEKRAEGVDPVDALVDGGSDILDKAILDETGGDSETEMDDVDDDEDADGGENQNLN